MDHEKPLRFDWDQMTVCVTGGNGFIGRRLCTRLATLGAHVIALDNNIAKRSEGLTENVAVRYADIRQPDSIQSDVERSDVVFHLAAIANPRTCEQDVNACFEHNIMGLKHVLQHSRRISHFIYLSSASVYGNAEYVPMDEQHPLLGNDTYGISKIIGEYLCKMYCQARGIPLTIIRLFNTFGPAQDQGYLIPSLIIQAMVAKRIEVWNSRPVRDFLYVDDTVDVLIKIANMGNTTAQIYNLGSGQGTSVENLAREVATHFNADISFLEKSTVSVTKLICDNRKLGQTIGWEPKVSLQDGLQLTIDYFRQLGASLVK